MNLPIKLGQTKACVGCQTVFITGRRHDSRAKYCSRDCWKKHWKGEATHMWGRKASDSTKKKLSDRWIGEKNPNYGKDMSGANNAKWIFDRSKLAKAGEQRNDTSHREWSIAVKKRDGWKCRIESLYCKGRLESHHILSYKEHPELRYQINNGITLCHAHHPKGRAEEKRLSPYLKDLVSVTKE